MNQLIHRIPKRYRNIVRKLVDHHEQHAFNNGKIVGIQEQHAENKKSKEHMRAEMYMTIQRLGDANAQIAIQLARILEKV